MTPEQYARVERIFHEAMKLPALQRGAYLDQACAEDGELRRQVESLLAHDRAVGTQGGSEGGATVGAPSVLSEAGEDEAGREAADRRLPRQLDEGDLREVGAYRILSVLGEGGFGVVYLAEQTEPIRRRVALKVIKRGMDTRAVIARFEQERQALAVMDHPSVARVLDAGTTAEGLPYFVMEHVAGEPITDYCDRHRLTVRQRLELFIPVCEAVQHAHMKGIIHRDIKPSNVLVMVKDERAVPKVIDFGIAKAISHALTQKTIFTEQGQLIGTPEYMSPEQAEMGATDIDTRTDVYSLGVLLYELLTGALPFNSRELRSKGYAEIQRIIREVEPPRPSTRLSTLGEQNTSVANARRMRLDELTAQLRKELEWIPLKAMRKDRVERYRSAADLADDVGNYLAHRPLIAGPERTGYKLRKFVRRNKVAVAAGAGISATLVLATGVSVWFGLNEASARRRESQALARESEQKNNAIAAEDRANKRADELKLVSDFQAQMLGQVDPTEAGKLLTQDVQARFEEALTKAGIPEPEAERAGQVEAFAAQWKRVNATDAARELIDRTILKPAIDAIDKQFKDQPVVDAALRQVLAERYRDMGLYDAALPLQESALATRRRVLGEEHPDTLTSINHMGFLLRDQGKLSEAEPYWREAIEKRRRVLGEEHPDTLTSINNMGVLLQDQGKLSEAEPYYREALEKYRRVLGEEHPETMDSINNMGSLLSAQGKFDQAEPYFREVLEKRRRVLGEEDAATVRSINSLGDLLLSQGKLDQAELYFREAMEKLRRLLGEEHPDTLFTISNMGALLHRLGKLSEAEPYFREALEKRRRVLGDEHPHTLLSIGWMGLVLRGLGQFAEAEPYYREAVAGFERKQGKDFWLTGNSRMGLGRTLVSLNRFAEAEPELVEAERVLSATQGVPAGRHKLCVESLVALYEAWDKAEPGSGYDLKAGQWKAKLEATTPPAAEPKLDSRK